MYFFSKLHHYLHHRYYFYLFYKLRLVERRDHITATHVPWQNNYFICFCWQFFSYCTVHRFCFVNAITTDITNFSNSCYGGFANKVWKEHVIVGVVANHYVCQTKMWVIIVIANAHCLVVHYTVSDVTYSYVDQHYQCEPYHLFSVAYHYSAVFVIFFTIW